MVESDYRRLRYMIEEYLVIYMLIRNDAYKYNVMHPDA
jgi:hypothetical protein